MDNDLDHPFPHPSTWEAILDESEEEAALGLSVPSDVVHAMLRASIEDMERDRGPSEARMILPAEE